jgi:hypothetical protein
MSGGVRWRPEVLDTDHPLPHDQGTDSALVQPAEADPQAGHDHRHISHDGGMPNPSQSKGDQMNKFRLAGWLAVGGLLGAALLAPSAALATDLHASQQGTAWNDPGFQGSAEDCDGLKLGPGDVVWHFVLTDPDADSGHLKATFDKAGAITVENADSPAAVLHFYVWTGHDTLLDAETTDVDGNLLNLSHICAGKEEESESVPVESHPVETESVPVESHPVETESVPVESHPVESHPVDSSTPEGSVEAATGTPKEDVTPPSTDTLTPANNTPSNDGWQLVLIALAALLATALVLTPASRKVRR